MWRWLCHRNTRKAAAIKETGSGRVQLFAGRAEPMVMVAWIEFERLSSSITSISVSYAHQREHILHMFEFYYVMIWVSSGKVGVPQFTIRQRNACPD